MVTKFLTVLLLLPGPAFGAFTDFYVATTGSNLNAGSSPGAHSVESVNGDWGNAAANRFTAASGTPFSGVSIGDWASIYLDGATATGYGARVTAVNGGGASIDLSATAKYGTAPATGATGRTCRINGAWAGTTLFPFGLIEATATNASGDPPMVWWKSGTYNCATAVTHSNAGPIFFETYGTTKGDKAGAVTIQGNTTGAAYTVLTLAGGNVSVEGFTFHSNGNSGTSSGVYLLTSTIAGNIIKRCSFLNSWKSALYNVNETLYWELEASNCYLSNTNGSNVGAIRLNLSGSAGIRLFAHENTLDGFSTDGGILLSNSITAFNGSSGAGSTGDENLFVYGCDFVGNGDNGYSLGDGSNDQMNCIFINCNWIDNANYGLRTNTQPTPGLFLGQGFGTGTAANGAGGLQYDKWFTVSNIVDYPANATPYEAIGSSDYRITLDEAVDAGFGQFTEEHPTYTGNTSASPSIGAAQQ